MNIKQLSHYLHFILFICCVQTNLFAQPSLQKIPQVGAVYQGTNYTYDLFFSTPDLGATHNYTNVTIVDTLPTWVNWVSSPGGGGFGTGVYNPIDRTVTWSAATLPDGATGAFSVVCQFNNTAVPDTNFLNKIRLFDNGVLLAVATATPVQVLEKAPTLTKTLFSGGTIGEESVYKLVTKNNGYTTSLTNYIVTDQLPVNAIFVSANNSAGAVVAGATVDVNNLVTFPPVTLTKGNSLTYYVHVRYPTPAFAVGNVVNNVAYGNGDFKNPIQITSTATHALTASTCVVNYAACSSVGTWYTNDAFHTEQFCFTLTNTGTSAISNVVLSDTLPIAFQATAASFGFDGSATPTNPLTVSYQKNGTGAWLPFTGSPFTAGQVIADVPTLLGFTGTDYLSAIRYEWASIPAGASFTAANFYLEGKVISPDHNNSLVIPAQICNKNYLNYTDCAGVARTKSGNVCNNLNVNNSTFTVDKRASATEWYIGQTNAAYYLNLKNTGNVALDSFFVTDTMPLMFRLTKINLSSAIAKAAKPVSLVYQKNGGGNWITWVGSPFTSAVTLNVASLGLTATDYVSAIKINAGAIPVAGSYINNDITLTGTVVNPQLDGSSLTLPANVKNYASFKTGGSSETDSIDVNIVMPYAQPTFAKSSTPTVVAPSDTITYTILVGNQMNTPLNDFTIMDHLNTNLDYVEGSAAVVCQTGNCYQTTPFVFTPISTPNFNGSACTLLSFAFDYAPNDGLPIKTNAQGLKITFKAVVKPTAVANVTIKNDIMFDYKGDPNMIYRYTCLGKIIDTFDINLNNSTIDTLCKVATVSNTTVAFIPAKPVFTKTSSPSTVRPLDTLTYTILAYNTTNIPLNSFDLIDALNPNLTYVANSAVATCQSGNCYVNTPYTFTTTATPNYQGTDSTLLRFSFDYANNDGLPLKTSAQGLKITFKAVLKNNVATGTVVKNDLMFSYVGSPAMPYQLTCKSQPVDAKDLNQNNLTNDTLCVAATTQFTTAAPIMAQPVFTKTSSPSTVNPSDTVTYTILAYNTTNIPLNDFALIDALSPNLTYVPNSAVATCQSGNCYMSTPYTFSATAMPNYLGTDSTLLRFSFDYANNDGLPLKTASQGLKITFKAVLKRSVILATNIKNDLMFQYTGNPAMLYQFTCLSQPVDAKDLNQNGSTTDNLCVAATTQFTSTAYPLAKPNFSKVGLPATVKPNDTLYYTVTVYNNATAPLNDFAILDYLNPNLNYVIGSQQVTCQTGNCYVNTPYIFTTTVTPNFNGSASTLVRFGFDYATNDGLPQKTATQGLKITFKAVVKPGVAQGTVIKNDIVFQYTGDPLMPYSYTCSGTMVDTADINQNGSKTDLLCKSGSTSNTISRYAYLESQKYVKGSLDTSYVVNGHTIPGGLSNYKLQIWNAGNVPVKKIKIVDVLPYVNDKKVLNNVPRVNPGASEWRPILTAALNGLATNRLGTTIPYTVQYSTDQVPCTAALTADNSFHMTDQAGCQSGNFSGTPPATISDVQSLFIDFGTNFILQPQDTLTLYWDMTAPFSATTSKLAWNSFAYIADYADNVVGGLQASEPPPVSIIISPNLGSIGNYVWFDDNGNGLQDEPDNLGIDGVRVELWSAGADGVIGGGDDIFQNFVLTQPLNGKSGYYLFAGLASGNYYVKLPTTISYYGSPLTTTTASATTGANNDSDVNAQTGFSPVISIDVNGTGIAKDNLTLDAGFKRQLTCPPTLCLPTNVQRN
ncbi:MAG: hypothetical protein RLZZ628_1319 [Bacteroidota bacterium]|jgi:uncharacterized repeat protein (TIGR01451 family)/fimbrial isopeptide formation D2 family protein